MGRTIPSFRQLLEIEKLDLSLYKKSLPTKNDKKAFDEIFESARLYTSYLSNASNPIVFESVVMGALFHNYKTLSETNKENDKVNENVATNEAKVLEKNKPQGKILFDSICKKWLGLADSLHKGDRELLLKKIPETWNHNEMGFDTMANSKESEYCTMHFSFYYS